MTAQPLPGLAPAHQHGRVWTLAVKAPAAPQKKRPKDAPPTWRPGPPVAWWGNLNSLPRHEMARYRLVNAWRRATRDAAIEAGLATFAGAGKVRLGRARLDVEFRFQRRATGGTRRDVKTNWAPTWKCVVDTLTADGRRVPKIPSLGIIPDDSPRYLCCDECPHVRVGEPIERGPMQPLGLVIVTITDWSGQVTP